VSQSVREMWANPEHRILKLCYRCWPQPDLDLAGMEAPLGFPRIRGWLGKQAAGMPFQGTCVCSLSPKKVPVSQEPGFCRLSSSGKVVRRRGLWRLNLLRTKGGGTTFREVVRGEAAGKGIHPYVVCVCVCLLSFQETSIVWKWNSCH
jgi:hypothetical protein